MSKQLHDPSSTCENIQETTRIIRETEMGKNVAECDEKFKVRLFSVYFIFVSH